MPTFVIGEFVYISLAILLLAHAVRQVCHLPAVKPDTIKIPLIWILLAILMF